MGNIISNHLLQSPNNADWEEYVKAGWRSDRAKELDNYGGLRRPPVARGNSLTARLILLEGACAEQGDNIQKELYKRWWEAKNAKRNAHKNIPRGDPEAVRSLSGKAHAPEREHSGKSAKESMKEVNSSRKKRQSGPGGDAKERVQEALQTREQHAQQGASTSTRAAKGPQSALEQQLAGTADLDLSPEATVPDFASFMLQPVACTTVVNERTGAPTQIADWRLHMHAARRRVILKVITIIRLRRGLVAPLRMRRVEHWGWAIPNVLGTEKLPRFVEDQKHLVQLHSQLKLLKGTYDALQTELRSDYQALLHSVGREDFPAHLITEMEPTTPGQPASPRTRAHSGAESSVSWAQSGGGLWQESSPRARSRPQLGAEGSAASFGQSVLGQERILDELW